MSRKRTVISILAAVAVIGLVIYVLPAAAQEEGGTQPKTGAGCAKQASAGAGCAKSMATAVADLSESEQKVVSYIVERIVEDGTVQFSEEQILADTGVSADDIRVSVLQPAVLAELEKRGFDIAAIAGGGGYCSKFSACSVDRNLNNASGEELARYQKEVARDGTTFADWAAPDFELPTTAGKTVSLSDYRGKNVALVFLSGHCYHSLDTLPILAELRQKYADKGLEILPVFINSGSPDDVKSRAWELDIDYPLLVSESKELSKAYESRMVPSTFLINEEGKITRKLVGFKDKEALETALEELVRS